MTQLETHALAYWISMQKLRGPVLSQTYARDIELPMLANDTPFQQIKTRIGKALQNDHQSTSTSHR